mmetsp:Transcript_27805/g.70241  ORF Transcript_27805/g.70241 Transcript_27805/m.70241 type:complete len:325 (+) Transcript_27805:2182-3156(+)
MFSSLFQFLFQLQHFVFEQLHLVFGRIHVVLGLVELLLRLLQLAAQVIRLRAHLSLDLRPQLLLNFGTGYSWGSRPLGAYLPASLHILLLQFHAQTVHPRLEQAFFMSQLLCELVLSIVHEPLVLAALFVERFPILLLQIPLRPICRLALRAQFVLEPEDGRRLLVDSERLLVNLPVTGAQFAAAGPASSALSIGQQFRDLLFQIFNLSSRLPSRVFFRFSRVVQLRIAAPQVVLERLAPLALPLQLALRAESFPPGTLQLPTHLHLLRMRMVLQLEGGVVMLAEATRGCGQCGSTGRSERGRVSGGRRRALAEVAKPSRTGSG